MKTNWSVFMKRLKTPPYDYTQLREIAFLILCLPRFAELLAIQWRRMEEPG